MAVGPVTLNGVIQRTQDVGMIRQQEDNKPFVEQQNILTHMKGQEQKQLKQVNHAEDSENYQKKYDAKEKGSNEYTGQGHKKKDSGKKQDGRVVPKQESSHFDIKI